jgi:hypothetical protein
MAVLTSPIPIKILCGCGQKYAFDVEPIGGRMPGPVKCPICGADGTSTANTLLSERFAAVPTTAPVAAGPSSGGIRIPAASVAAPASTRAPAAAVRIPMPATPTPGPSVQRLSVSGYTPAAAPALAPVAAPVAQVAAAPHTPIASAAVAGRVGRLPGQIDPEQARKEARSKILWGDDAPTVIMFLKTQGFDAQEANQIVQAVLDERKKSIRSNGMKKIFTGIGMLCVPAVVGVLFLIVDFLPIQLLGAAVCIGIWGFFRGLSGMLMVLAPKGEKGNVSEM